MAEQWRQVLEQRIQQDLQPQGSISAQSPQPLPQGQQARQPGLDLGLPSEPEPSQPTAGPIDVVRQRIAEQQGSVPGISYQDIYNQTPEGIRAQTSAGMSNLQQFMVGMGREASQLVKGAGQIVTQITGTPEEAAQNQAAIAEETALYERNRPDSFATTAGEFAGMVAPAAAVPLAPAATAAGRIGTAGAMGALEAGLQPVESGSFAEEKSKQIAIGGAVGAGLQKGIEGIANVAKRSLSGFSSPIPETQDVLEAAKEHGIFVGLADITESSIPKLIDKGASYTPFFGTRKSKIMQMEQALRASENLSRTMINGGDRTEAIGLGIQKSLASHKRMLQDASQKLYDGVADRLEAKNALDMKIIPTNVNNLMAQLGEEPLPPMVFDALRSPNTPDYDQSLVEYMRQARDTAQGFIEKGGPKGRQAGALQKAIEDASRADIESFLRAQGGKPLVDEFGRAQRNYAETLATYQKKYGAKDIDEMIKTSDYDKIFAKYVNNQGRGKSAQPQKLYDHLTPEGHELVRHKMIDDAIAEATKGKPRFDPGAFTQTINKNQGAVDVFFKDDHKRTLNNLTKVFKHIDRAKEVENDAIWTQIASNPAVFGPLFGGANLAMGGSIVTGAATGLASGAAIGGVAKLFLATPKGRDLLLKSVKGEPGTKVFTNNLSRAIPAAMEAYMVHYADDLRAEQQRQQPLFPEGGGA